MELHTTLLKLAKLLDTRKEQLGVNPRIAKDLSVVAVRLAKELTK